MRCVIVEGGEWRPESALARVLFQGDHAHSALVEAEEARTQLIELLVVKGHHHAHCAFDVVTRQFRALARGVVGGSGPHSRFSICSLSRSRSSSVTSDALADLQNSCISHLRRPHVLLLPGAARVWDRAHRFHQGSAAWRTSTSCEKRRLCSARGSANSSSPPCDRADICRSGRGGMAPSMSGVAGSAPPLRGVGVASKSSTCAR
jgi:hypothetical protein